MKTPILIRVYYENELIEVKQFTDSQVVIGRADSVQIQLNNDSVAPLHALIEERDSGYYIADLGAESGILKEGQKILDEPLATGDQFQIGPYQFEFFIGVPKPKAPPAETSSLDKPKNENTEKSSLGEAVVAKEIPSPPPLVELQSSDNEPEKDTKDKKLDLISELHNEPVVKGVDASTANANKGTKESQAKNFPYKKKYTFAPQGQIQDLDTHLTGGEGSQIEVIVAWGDRILAQHFYSQQISSLSVGRQATNQLIIPFGQKHELVINRGGPKIVLNASMKATIILNKNGNVSKTSLSGPTQIDIRSGELIKIEQSDEPLVLYIRQAQDTKKPIAAPIVELTLSDLTTLVFTFVIAAIFGVYMFIYAPIVEDQPLFEEPLRKATVKFSPPKIARVEPEKIVVKEATQKQQNKKQENKVTKVDPGKAKAVAPTKVTKSNKNKLTSARPGGSVKTGNKAGASAKTVKKDPTELGLLGALSGKGIQKQLNQTSSGSGELFGMAEKSTGYSGLDSDRAGEQLGTSLKSVGKSGKGSATVGIGDIKTSGQGKGLTGLGTGVVGKRAKINFQLGGDEEDFVGRIDRDAVKRVILANKRSFRYCYNKELKSNSSLYGKLVMRWDIVEGGRVRNVTVVRNTIENKRIADCVGNVLMGLKFPEPPPESEAVVQFPFVFSSQ